MVSRDFIVSYVKQFLFRSQHEYSKQEMKRYVYWLFNAEKEPKFLFIHL